MRIDKLHKTYKGRVVAKPGTLFDKPLINTLIKTAKENLSRDNQLQSVLFINTSKLDKPIITPINTPSENHEDKVLYMKAINAFFIDKADKFGEITEVIMIADAYYLEAKTKQLDNVEYPIRHNVNRKEAIVLTGRDSTGNKNLMAMLPYTRTDNKFNFDKPIITLNSKDNHSTGLIDYVFNPKLGEILESIQNSKSTLTN